MIEAEKPELNVQKGSKEKIFVSLKHELFHCFRVLFSSLEMNVHYLENESTLIFDHIHTLVWKMGFFHTIV